MDSLCGYTLGVVSSPGLPGMRSLSATTRRVLHRGGRVGHPVDTQLCSQVRTPPPAPTKEKITVVITIFCVLQGPWGVLHLHHFCLFDVLALVFISLVLAPPASCRQSPAFLSGFLTLFLTPILTSGLFYAIWLLFWQNSTVLIEFLKSIKSVAFREKKKRERN